MARVHLFADEAGNFDFSRKAGASRFFILTTVAFPEGHDALATSLRALRFDLAWEGVDFRREFHATDDTQRVRDRVFEVLAAHDFRVDATILEKPKARPGIRSSEERFYRAAWLFHLRALLPSSLPLEGSELHLVAASIGTGRQRGPFMMAVESAVRDATAETRACVLASRRGCVPTGCRLLRLGDPAQVGAWRRSSVWPDPGSRCARAGSLPPRAADLLLIR